LRVEQSRPFARPALVLPEGTRLPPLDQESRRMLDKHLAPINRPSRFLVHQVVKLNEELVVTNRRGLLSIYFGAHEVVVVFVANSSSLANLSETTNVFFLQELGGCSGCCPEALFERRSLGPRVGGLQHELEITNALLEARKNTGWPACRRTLRQKGIVPGRIDQFEL
jgi:hypothetical protein